MKRLTSKTKDNNNALECLEALYNNAKIESGWVKKHCITYAEEFEHNDRIKPYYETIKQVLLSKQVSVENNETLKCLEKLDKSLKYIDFYKFQSNYEEYINTIKQALTTKSKKEMAWEYMKEVFKTSSTYTYKLKDSLECGWITQEKYDLIMEMLDNE